MVKNRILHAFDALRGRRPRGGYENLLSGAGGRSDKAAAGGFYPTVFTSRHRLDTIYVESWAAAKIIDIPVDDSCIRWRAFESDDKRSLDRMRDAEQRHDVRGRLSRAMKMGRLYGTGLLVMVTREAPLEEPLVVERVKEGDLVSLLPVDRYDATVETRNADLFAPTFGEPLRYRLQVQVPGSNVSDVVVHASRVLRFDGRRPLSLRGWESGYERDWGVSELVQVLTSITQDAGIASGIAHLAQEASMLVVKLKDYQEAITGGGLGPDAMTAAEIAEAINVYKSLWQTIFTDKDSEISRVAVAWPGLPDLLDRFPRRMAAAADIPATRFFGQSPVGMNATGESDMRNYALRVAAMQERLLTGPLFHLDAVLARDAGLGEPLPYHWLSLMDQSEQDQAAVSKMRAEAVGIAMTHNLADEDEGRSALSGDVLFGELPPMDRLDGPSS